MHDTREGPSRRGALALIGAGAAGLALTRAAAAQSEPPIPAGPVAPPSTTSMPPRSFAPDAEPNTYFYDADIVVTDERFASLVQPNAPIQRLWTGALWSEGPAWNGVGKFLVWSDIPNNRQMRWLEDDGRVSVFRMPSNNSNGNTFDYQGRQLSCEHLTRRVVRYELDGSITVLAESFEGQRLNSPNDIVPHTDGSYFFTDPPYGGQLYEGTPDAPGGPSNPDGLLNNRVGQPVGVSDGRRVMETATYRIAPDGRITRIIGEGDVPDPNGLCLSPDQRRIYVASTGKGPGDTGEGGQGNIFVGDLAADGTVSNVRVFSDCVVDGVKCGPDGLRCDVYGNVWSSSNAGRAIGYNGVTVWSPEGELLGRIRVPEVVGNLTFGGPKRNRLFMAGSQSLYAVYTASQGAAPG